MASDNNRPLNSKSKQIVYSVSCFLKKKPFGLRSWKGHLIRTTFAQSREKSERGRLSAPTGANSEPYNYVESFDKAAIRHNTILHCEETLANYISEFSLGLDSSFPGGVETLRKRLGLLVYCWKKRLVTAGKLL